MSYFCNYGTKPQGGLLFMLHSVDVVYFVVFTSIDCVQFLSLVYYYVGIFL